MGSKTFVILAEMYIQHMEHKQIYLVLMTYQIVGYFWYVDDIFIIYKQNKTNIHGTLPEFNKQPTNIKFTIAKEQHDSIDFLILEYT
jgi:hypothetical protein